MSKWTQHVKTVLKRGGTMKQAAASWKPGTRTHRVRRAATRTTRRVKTIARRRYSRSRRHHRSGFGTQGIFKLLRIAALAAPAVAEAVSSASPQDKVMHALANYTGYDFMSGTVNPSWLIRGYGPFLLTSLATIGIPKLMGIIKKVV